ncbi:MAG: D-hexose-6-phosphate mutarotase, partial [Propionibacteriaceae bacterium]|nr:D-hexose-6-phosphate mutarotase [Propionibacteriaceae bacterium]
AGQPDVLWVSAESAYRAGRSIRGGIPICAPWFGAGRGEEPVPQAHGFVRAVPWHLVAARQDGPVVELVFGLESADVAGQPGAERYPLDLGYRYTVRFGAQLEVALTVTSPSSPFVLDEALHTYFAVSDVRAICVRGLDGVSYLDKTAAGAHGTQSGDIRFDAETDRVYAGAPVTEIIDGSRRTRVTPSGSASTVVWNPWADRAREMAEFGDDEWISMVCVETANALEGAVSVPAGGSTTLGVTISRL